MNSWSTSKRETNHYRKIDLLLDPRIKEREPRESTPITRVFSKQKKCFLKTIPTGGVNVFTGLAEHETSDYYERVDSGVYTKQP